jgi:hypothetical protein
MRKKLLPYIGYLLFSLLGEFICQAITHNS